MITRYASPHCVLPDAARPLARLCNASSERLFSACMAQISAGCHLCRELIVVHDSSLLAHLQAFCRLKPCRHSASSCIFQPAPYDSSPPMPLILGHGHLLMLGDTQRSKQRECPCQVTCGVHDSVLEEVEASISAAVKRAGVKANIIVCGQTEWRFLDIVSHRAGKLAALEYAADLCSCMHGLIGASSAWSLVEMSPSAGCLAANAACHPVIGQRMHTFVRK